MFSEEGFARLLDAFDRLRSTYTLVRVIPFVHALEPELTLAGVPVVIMGTYTLAEIARQRGWAPGSFHNENFDYEVQAHHWKMLNGDCEVSSIQDVVADPLYGGTDRDRFFIRPIHDTKSFAGQVMDWPSFVSWRQALARLQPEDVSSVDLDTKVIVAPVREIWREYRLWVVDKRIVTASLYKFGTIKRYEEGAPPWVMRFAQKEIRKWVPARAFVMDVFETKDGLFVGEVNNFNCAGFYAGDMQKLVAAIEAME
jgi:hypothetical protein